MLYFRLCDTSGIYGYHLIAVSPTCLCLYTDYIRMGDCRIMFWSMPHSDNREEYVAGYM